PRPIVVDGRLYAFYRIRPEADAAEGTPQRLAVGVSGDEGQSWDETVIARADDASEPIPTYDPERGTFYVVWHDNRNGDLDAFVSTSSDGATWSEPLRMNDDPEETTTGQFYPQLALAPDGRLDVAWYDYRDDTYPAPQPDPDSGLNLFNNMGKQQSVYLTSSHDGGRTWTPNVRVNDVRIDRTIGLWDPNYFFQVPLSVASSDDRTLVAWSDTRNGDAVTGTQDIVTAAVAASTDEGDRNLLLLGGGAGLVLGAGLAAFAMLALLRRWTRSAAP
ncbi:MAG TPA: sialidase family protein, partial [Nitriliruptorales bacterium]|nr:sialidase family protein [Nitriliruptorales bacterium]